MTTFKRRRYRPATLAAAATFLVASLCSLQALALKPFTATYTANYMGLQANGRMTLASAGGNRWTYSLDIQSSIAQLSQSTTFEDDGGQWKPLSGSDSSQLLIKQKKTNANYDWASHTATWSGDVKPDQAGPVPLQTGDLDGMLINLAIARDAAAGKPMHYRMVDGGRAKQLDYQVVGKESITIGGQAHEATKVSTASGDKQTLVWIVDGVPVPARILQRKDGKDEIDLRMTAMH